MNAEGLRARLAGDLSCAGEPAHALRRGELVWNAYAPPAAVAAIARVASSDDIAECVRHARRHGMRIAVRGGGHHWSGTPLHAGALVLDLSRLSFIDIDASARRARVGPAVTGRDFAQYLAAHGLAFPCGHCPSVPLSGFLLGGGLGWNQGAWGPGCASVEAVEVVTAAGEVVIADRARDSDLFWAARGAGPGFCGVVSAFHLHLHALPGAIRTRVFAWPLARAGEIAHWLETVTARMAACVEAVVCIAAAPPELAVEDGTGMACFVLVTAFAENEAAALGAMAPFDHAIPAAPLMQSAPAATDFNGLFDDVARLFPPAHRYLADTFWSHGPAAESLALIANAYAEAPSPQSLALAVFGLPPGDVDALQLPGGMLSICYGVWNAPERDRDNRAWHEGLVQGLEPLSAGHYVGEADLRRPGRAERCFRPHAWQRLERVRQTRDPEGLFCSFPV